jgi:hypothetical protein
MAKKSKRFTCPDCRKGGFKSLLGVSRHRGKIERGCIITDTIIDVVEDLGRQAAQEEQEDKDRLNSQSSIRNGGPDRDSELDEEVLWRVKRSRYEGVEAGDLGDSQLATDMDVIMEEVGPCRGVLAQDDCDLLTERSEGPLFVRY